MSKPLGRVILVFCSISLGSLAAGETVASVPPIAEAFASTSVRIMVTPNAKTFTTEWTYTNHWNFPMLVERFDQSCSCLSALHNVDTVSPIEPGKTGVIRANFTPGDHRGLLRKSIHVRFVGHAQPVELVAEALIPSGVELSQRELVWASSEDQTIAVDVTTGTDTPFAITALLGVPEQFFSITQETITPSKHYRVSITPKSNRDNSVHCLQIRTDSKDPRDQVVAVYLRAENTPAKSGSN